MAESIDSTLAQRGSRYGVFAVHAEHTQALKKLLRQLMGEDKWNSLHQDQQEALEMIAHKLGRITNGDPNYDDSWRDIAGYAQLVANRLAGQAEPVKFDPEAAGKAKAALTAATSWMAAGTTDPESIAKAEAMQACIEATEALGKLAAKAMEACRPTLKVGDRVRITHDSQAARTKCINSRAGWNFLMHLQCGQLGTVVEVSEYDTFRVKTLSGDSYWWASGCLEHAPAEQEPEPEAEAKGTAVHMIVLDDSDPDVEAIQRMLAGFLRGQ